MSPAPEGASLEYALKSLHRVGPFAGLGECRKALQGAAHRGGFSRRKGSAQAIPTNAPAVRGRLRTTEHRPVLFR